MRSCNVFATIRCAMMASFSVISPGSNSLVTRNCRAASAVQHLSLELKYIPLLREAQLELTIEPLIKTFPYANIGVNNKEGDPNPCPHMMGEFQNCDTNGPTDLSMIGNFQYASIQSFTFWPWQSHLDYLHEKTWTKKRKTHEQVFHTTDEIMRVVDSQSKTRTVGRVCLRVLESAGLPRSLLVEIFGWLPIPMLSFQPQ